MVSRLREEEEQDIDLRKPEMRLRGARELGKSLCCSSEAKILVPS